MATTFLVYTRDMNYDKTLVLVTKDWEKAKEIENKICEEHEYDDSFLDCIIDEWEDDVLFGKCK